MGRQPTVSAAGERKQFYREVGEPKISCPYLLSL